MTSYLLTMKSELPSPHVSYLHSSVVGFLVHLGAKNKLPETIMFTALA